MVELCCEVHHMCLGNQELELQEREICINLNKRIILAIIMLVINKNPQGYKEQVIPFIDFSFLEVVTVNYWLSNVNLYVSNIEE